MKHGARVVLLACGSLLVTLGFFALAVVGWSGDWGSFLSDPVRRASFVAGHMRRVHGGPHHGFTHEVVDGRLVFRRCPGGNRRRR